MLILPVLYLKRKKKIEKNPCYMALIFIKYYINIIATHHAIFANTNSMPFNNHIY